MAFSLTPTPSLLHVLNAPFRSFHPFLKPSLPPPKVCWFVLTEKKGKGPYQGSLGCTQGSGPEDPGVGDPWPDGLPVLKGEEVVNEVFMDLDCLLLC